MRKHTFHALQACLSSSYFSLSFDSPMDLLATPLEIGLASSYSHYTPVVRFGPSLPNDGVRAASN
jgi:hypothetical protein